MSKFEKYILGGVLLAVVYASLGFYVGYHWHEVPRAPSSSVSGPVQETSVVREAAQSHSAPTPDPLQDALERTWKTTPQREPFRANDAVARAGVTEKERPPVESNWTKTTLRPRSETSRTRSAVQPQSARKRPRSVVRRRVAENGSYYGQVSTNTGRPKTVYVRGYYRRDGTYVRAHYRSRPRR